MSLALMKSLGSSVVAVPPMTGFQAFAQSGTSVMVSAVLLQICIMHLSFVTHMATMRDHPAAPVQLDGQRGNNEMPAAEDSTGELGPEGMPFGEN